MGNVLADHESKGNEGKQDSIFVNMQNNNNTRINNNLLTIELSDIKKIPEVNSVEV